MSELAEALAGLNEDYVTKIVQRKVTAGEDPECILAELRQGMDIVGARHKKGEYFLGELVFSGEIFKNAMKTIEPRLAKNQSGKEQVKLVLGTVKGDIHNIGKDIVGNLLKIAGFDVYDLGIDVPKNAFVKKLKETDAAILGMSGLLTPSFEAMKETVEALKTAGLRYKVKVIVGGGIVTELVRKHCGADAWTDDGIKGVEICRAWAQEMKK